MSTVLEISERRSTPDAQPAGLAEYRQLVLDIVLDKSPSNGMIKKTLAAAGRSQEQLDVDVARARERHEAWQSLTQGTGRLAELQREYAAHKAKMEQAERAWQELLDRVNGKQVMELRLQQRTLSRDLTKLEYDQRQLLDTTADPAIARKIDSNGYRIAALEQAIRDRQSDIARKGDVQQRVDEATARLELLGRLNEAIKRGDCPPNPGLADEVAELRRRSEVAKTMLAKIAELEKRSAANAAEIAALEAEQEELAQSRQDWRNTAID